MPVDAAELPRVDGVPEEAYAQLAGRYGHAAHEVLRFAGERPRAGRSRSSRAVPDLLAEAVYAARASRPARVGDVLLRRTRLALTAAREVTRRRGAPAGWRRRWRRARLGRSAAARGCAFRRGRRRGHRRRLACATSAATCRLHPSCASPILTLALLLVARPGGRGALVRRRVDRRRRRAAGRRPRHRGGRRRSSTSRAASAWLVAARARAGWGAPARAEPARHDRGGGRGGPDGRLAVAWIQDGTSSATLVGAPAVPLSARRRRLGPGDRDGRQRRRLRGLDAERRRARRAAARAATWTAVPAPLDVDPARPRRREPEVAVAADGSALVALDRGRPRLRPPDLRDDAVGAAAGRRRGRLAAGRHRVRPLVRLGGLPAGHAQRSRARGCAPRRSRRRTRSTAASTAPAPDVVDELERRRPRGQRHGDRLAGRRAAARRRVPPARPAATAAGGVTGRRAGVLRARRHGGRVAGRRRRPRPAGCRTAAALGGDGACSARGAVPGRCRRRRTASATWRWRSSSRRRRRRGDVRPAAERADAAQPARRGRPQRARALGPGPGVRRPPALPRAGRRPTGGDDGRYLAARAAAARARTGSSSIGVDRRGQRSVARAPADRHRAVSHARCFLRLRGRVIELGARPLLMGIVNATPDSFSDAGDHPPATRVARRRAARGRRRPHRRRRRVGAAATSPAVAAEEEIERVVPLIERIAGARRAVSVDTYKPEVAEAAIAAGAALVNDVSGLRDPALADVCARTGAGLVIMHTRVAPKGTLLDPGRYDDVVADVTRLPARADGGRDRAAASTPSSCCSTPGPTSPRRPAQTVAVLRRLDGPARARAAAPARRLEQGLRRRAHRAAAARAARRARWRRVAHGRGGGRAGPARPRRRRRGRLPARAGRSARGARARAGRGPRRPDRYPD